ncbi:MAG: secretion system protein TadC [Pseudonocardiales bacterium]|nr:MAG: secretion system protein TadC [Pseudonocardiales bacterium]
MTTAQTILYAGLAAIFIAVVLVLAALGGATGKRAQVSRSLAAIRGLASVPPSMRREEDKTFEERVLGPGMARLTRMGRRLTPAGQTDRYRRKLENAGSPLRWDTDRVLGVKMLGLVGGAALLLLLAVALSGGILAIVAVTAVGGATGFFAVDLWLYQKGYNRRERMQRELPDALDLLTISVEAGLAFDSALSQVARNTEGPLAEEFQRVLQEMQIGVGRPAAMRALAERTDQPELRGFVSAMVQADTFGIPIANVLRIQASEMRLKRSQRAEEKAQKVPVKILFPLIFCILPALFVVVIGPAAISIVRTFTGGSP